MIDRVWRIWQLRHPPPNFTADYLNTTPTTYVSPTRSIPRQSR